MCLLVLNGTRLHVYPLSSTMAGSGWQISKVNGKFQTGEGADCLLQVRRQPNLGSDPQLRRHLLTLYQDLSHQSQTNQLKISAIQGKLKVLNLHTKSDMIKLKSDPRIAF